MLKEKGLQTRLEPRHATNNLQENTWYIHHTNNKTS